jgi:SAM-dependent methyltransferase
MKVGALEPYEGALRGSGRLSLITADGRSLPLAIDRYLEDADGADHTVLSRCLAPVLDVGCGPGRMVYALSAAGIPALGVDIADFAVALTVERGAAALSRDVFDRVPGEGRWPTVLLLDGNVGIGGDVYRLLHRVSELIAPGGSLIVEASTTVQGTDESIEVRFGDADGPTGPTFDWAVVARDVLRSHAVRAGLSVLDQWSADGRDFVRLARRTLTR